jgi:hypothetical protein
MERGGTVMTKEKQTVGLGLAESIQYLLILTQSMRDVLIDEGVIPEDKFREKFIEHMMPMAEASAMAMANAGDSFGRGPLPTMEEEENPWVIKID